MSDSDTDSTDSDNNNVVSPFFDDFMGIPRAPRYELPESPDIETDNSSDSEIDLHEFNHVGASTSDVWFLFLEI